MMNPPGYRPLQVYNESRSLVYRTVRLHFNYIGTYLRSSVLTLDSAPGFGAGQCSRTASVTACFRSRRAVFDDDRTDASTTAGRASSSSSGSGGTRRGQGMSPDAMTVRGGLRGAAPARDPLVSVAAGSVQLRLRYSAG